MNTEDVSAIVNPSKLIKEVLLFFHRFLKPIFIEFIGVYLLLLFIRISTPPAYFSQQPAPEYSGPTHCLNFDFSDFVMDFDFVSFIIMVFI